MYRNVNCRYLQGAHERRPKIVEGRHDCQLKIIFRTSKTTLMSFDKTLTGKLNGRMHERVYKTTRYFSILDHVYMYLSIYGERMRERASLSLVIWRRLVPADDWWTAG